MSAALALQKALYARLMATPALQAIVGARVYDRVPPGAALPYVALREFQAVEADTGDAWEVFAGLDVWSDREGKPEAAAAAGAIRDGVHGQDLDLAEPYALVEIRHQDTQIGDAGDGVTTRARISFRALIDRV